MEHDRDHRNRPEQAEGTGAPEPPLRAATADEVGETLAFALRFAGRRRVQTAEDAMARITAERLVEHLGRSGFVVMKRPDQAAPSTSGHRHPNTD